ncbi:hypothetical protein [Streptomyces clavuligerus]|uniref:hypothetical protein n=1 Tax=Streptomyces clavuligerus TaxID=1901 RepID=UPI001E61985E|nr:hypothetical protein [Streptomyces clavuligerus]
MLTRRSLLLGAGGGASLAAFPPPPPPPDGKPLWLPRDNGAATRSPPTPSPWWTRSRTDPFAERPARAN